MAVELLDSRNPFTPAEKARDFDSLTRQRLGVVVGGSLQEGMVIKLDAKTMIEGLAVGSYVTIDGQTGKKFFGIVSDISLDSADQNVQKMPPDIQGENDFIAQVYRGTAVFGMLHVKPMLVAEGSGAKATIKPVKTVPSHFVVAYKSTPEEVESIFASGDDGTTKPYEIGASVDDETVKIHLNLERLVERSSAIFGRSGTGKTFLALPLLASVIKQEAASVLIFDMHNDYGYTLKGDKKRKVQRAQATRRHRQQSRGS